MKQIDHNPNETRETNTVFWIVWSMVGLCWADFLYFGLVEWRSAALGAFTGMVLASWAIEVSGNKVPESWTRKPPGS